MPVECTAIPPPDYQGKGQRFARRGVAARFAPGLSVHLAFGLFLILSFPPALVLADRPVSVDTPVAAPQAVDPAAKKLVAADGLLQRNLFKLAADEYEQFLHDYPQDAQITAGRYGLAICRYRLSQFDLAAPLLRQVLSDQQFGQTDQVLALLGYCEMSGRDYDDAIQHFDQLIAKYPQSPQTDPARLYRANRSICQANPKSRLTHARNFCKRIPRAPTPPRRSIFSPSRINRSARTIRLSHNSIG